MARIARLAVLAAAVLAASVAGAKFNVLATGTAFDAVRVVREEPGQRLPGFASADVIAVAEYNDTMFTTGWDVMKIETSPSFPDEQQAYAAGYFEGTQTAQKAVDHYYNNYPTPPPQYAVDFLMNHTTWLENKLASMTTKDAYWTHVDLMWKQWQGLFAGINAAPGPNMTKAQLITLTSLGDMFDIIPGLKPQSRPDWRKMPTHEYMQWFAAQTHCTSLFKVTEDLKDIFFGHVAWNKLVTMMRIFKHITLNFNAAQTTAKTITMSSYPGLLSSFDDFYMTDSGLNVIETSLAVLNDKMYEGNIRPDLLLYWMRVMVSNRMATSASEWASLVAYLNSGTYNNQWMVLDLNKFTPGKPLVKDTMWVAEQMPGIVASKDVTEMLRYGYYPSYNVPMNKTLFEMGGYPEAVKIHGPNMNSYQQCVRARIFRRDQTSVTDLASYKHMMQYNDFESDPISQGNPLFAISSRVDLDPHHPQCFGAIDAKVSSYSLWKEGMITHAHSGPTPQQPTFGFNTTWANCTQHVGLVEMYQFGWEIMKP
eukprot:CAMPEP_0174835438 /NCGR_PEP_ID=MMETSP1114-20130205/5403_1 /TAXON_ID=312471 /ORGANISM="Neobodo designis, Strain CCAP 1951/1" /LENGTH=536 /DNA_ID=CAMNT_0016069385 /DNA_START=125 /DNA_END=1735 /DNA_ORIENTATION=+